MVAPRLHLRPSAPARRWRSKKGDPPSEAAAREALGRSRGGLTTKLHALADALGNPVRLLVTPGQRGDVPFAAALVEGLGPLAVVADTAYDATHFRARLALTGAAAVILPSSSRALKPNYDATLYRERNLVERFFGRLNQNRRLATRYEKTAESYLGVLHVAAALDWIRHGLT